MNDEEKEEKATGQNGQRESGQIAQTNTKEVTKNNKHTDIDKVTSENKPQTIRKAFEDYWKVLSPNPSQILKLTEVAKSLTTEVVIEGMRRARYRDDPF
ncbi:hypothetical protein [Halobacteroides halobius]|uniref:hypothetical protein n=1 Tax=Halobacteroides halobius TaxID=42422 RepID=UPI0005A1F70E|nr:hypothetical protein [Halobacteroides halobius]